jgi:hypothetical protein
LDSEVVHDEEEQYQLITRHIRKINEHPMWKLAHKIFIPENNMKMAASHFERYVRDFRDVTTYYRNGKNPGVLKSETATIAYQKQMVGALFRKKLLFERDMVTSSHKQTVEQVLKNLREEFERFHWDPRTDSKSNEVRGFKLTGKQGQKQDDSCVTIQMVYKYGLDLHNDPRDDVFRNVNQALVEKVAKINFIKNHS